MGRKIRNVLHLVVLVLENKCLATCKKVRITLRVRVKVNVQLNVTTALNVSLQRDKTKKFIHCRFSLKPFHIFFIYCIRT
jgi:hypothetical protein